MPVNNTDPEKATYEFQKKFIDSINDSLAIIKNRSERMFKYIVKKHSFSDDLAYYASKLKELAETAEWIENKQFIHESTEHIDSTTINRVIRTFYDNINTEETLRDFFQVLYSDLDLSFHPDEPFSEYVDASGNSVFDPMQADRMNEILQQCFDFCSQNGLDIYDIATQLQIPELQKRSVLPDNIEEALDSFIKKPENIYNNSGDEEITVTKTFVNNFNGGETIEITGRPVFNADNKNCLDLIGKDGKVKACILYYQEEFVEGNSSWHYVYAPVDANAEEYFNKLKNGDLNEEVGVAPAKISNVPEVGQEFFDAENNKKFKIGQVKNNFLYLEYENGDDSNVVDVLNFQRCIDKGKYTPTESVMLDEAENNV